jgi:hypothetical protein
VSVLRVFTKRGGDEDTRRRMHRDTLKIVSFGPTKLPLFLNPGEGVGLTYQKADPEIIVNHPAGPSVVLSLSEE